MRSEQSGPVKAENPFFGPELKSKWAQLARRGGDRVSILFEDLRKRVGAIEGLSEELFFVGEDEGWAPRYSLGDRKLFTAHVRPGLLEVELSMNASERAALLASRSLAGTLRGAFESAREEAGKFKVRFAMKSGADVRAFARLIVRRARMLSAQRTSVQPLPVTRAIGLASN
jgi:hypothetical protein